MYYIKRRYPLWWEKCNYILTGALSSGVAMSSLLVYFVRATGHDLCWWGNILDSQEIKGRRDTPARLNAEDVLGGYVGLRKGHFP